MTTSITRRFFLPTFKGPVQRTIIPFFMPFAGCSIRCLFCAQDRQSGQDLAPVPQRLQALRRQLAVPAPRGTRRELAFYGGTFTRIAPEIQQACLQLAKEALAEGTLASVRCSTRPDAVSPGHLAPLREHGISLIELGVQSFQDTALKASCRGYTGSVALEGCQAVQRAGFELGIQLLPGMPGLSPAAFLADVDTALSLAPSCLRLYPCLVLKGTVLAEHWKRGCFQPWSLDETVATLGEALRRIWQADVPVIRMGLAPDPGLDAAFLAGPRHPALGSMVQGVALLRTVEHSLADVQDVSSIRLHLPEACQGFFYGHQGSLRSQWARMGVSQIIWHQASHGAWSARLRGGSTHTPKNAE